MTSTPRGRDGAGEERPERNAESETAIAAVSAYSTSPDRTVFTESGNADGWIATDLTVEPER